jgi:hypothetical protein
LVAMFTRGTLSAHALDDCGPDPDIVNAAKAIIRALTQTQQTSTANTVQNSAASECTLQLFGVCLIKST